MAILLSILMSLGLLTNSNVTNHTAVDARDHINTAGQYGSGTWEWDNSH
jgi:hypothetical protein